MNSSVKSLRRKWGRKSVEVPVRGWSCQVCRNGRASTLVSGFGDSFIACNDCVRVLRKTPGYGVARFEPLPTTYKPLI